MHVCASLVSAAGCWVGAGARVRARAGAGAGAGCGTAAFWGAAATRQRTVVAAQHIRAVAAGLIL